MRNIPKHNHVSEVEFTFGGTLEGYISKTLKEVIELNEPGDIKKLTNCIVGAVYDALEAEGGIWEPTQGEWFTWLMRPHIRTFSVDDEEIERFEEELAVVFMQGDLDGDTTDRLLATLSMMRKKNFKPPWPPNNHFDWRKRLNISKA